RVFFGSRGLVNRRGVVQCHTSEVPLSRLGPHALLRARVYLALSMSAAACGDTAGDSVIDHPTSSTSGGELVAPPPPRLLAPADGAEDVPIQTELCWTQAAPEGRVRYRVFVDGIELSQG